MKSLRLGFIISVLLIITSCSSKKVLSAVERDGSSFEKAIVVNGISEEYEYVKKVCSDCQFLGQALAFDKKNPFDILRFKNAKGETISYYFDISKFFGKGW